MSEEIIKVIDVLAAKLGIAIDWTSANVTPYLQQLAERYISYEIANNIYWIVVWVVVTIAAWVSCFVCYRKSQWKEFGFDDESWTCWTAITFGIIGVIATLIALIVTLVYGKDIIACIMLPEMVILDYLKGMM